MFSKSLIPLLFCCAMLGAGSAQAQSASIVGATSVAHADPSSQQIYAAARAGRLDQAQQMVEQVLRDYPSNAKAHYVAAEVYARSGDIVRARRELRTAQSLNPDLSFATPAAVSELEQQLNGGRVLYGTPVSRSHGVSWGGIVLVVAGIALIFALVRRRSAPPNPYQTYGAYPGQAGPYPGAPYPGAGPYGAPMGGGSGLMGSLATGLAVGAGVAAGEELVGHMLNSGSGGPLPSAGAAEPAQPSNADMGGNDFGITDGNSWDSGGGGDFGGDMGGGDMGGGGGDWT